MRNSDIELLTALRITCGTSPFTARDVINMCTGRAAKENPELASALGPHITNAKRLGAVLKRLQGQRAASWVLQADFSTRLRRWEYRFWDTTSIPTASEVGQMMYAEAQKNQDAFDAKLKGKSLAQQSRLVDKMLDRVDAANEKISADLEREIRIGNGREALKDLRRAEVAAQAADDRRAAQASVLHPRQSFSEALSLEIQKTVHRPERGVECQRRRQSENSPQWIIRVLLFGEWAQRKARWLQLQQLWLSKRWCSENERAFDGVTAELRRGAEIPATASREPSHYNTAAATVSLANELAAAGVSSVELPLEKAIQQRRWNAGWHLGVGGDMHRPPGLHSNPLGAIRMKKFDPLRRPGDPEDL